MIGLRVDAEFRVSRPSLTSAEPPTTSPVIPVFGGIALKRALLALTALLAIIPCAFAQRSYDNATLIVVYTDAQSLEQNLNDLNAYIDENIEPNLEYTVVAESGIFDGLFGYRLVRFRAFDENGNELLMGFDDYRVLDGLEAFWATQIPDNVVAVYTNAMEVFEDFDLATASVAGGSSTTATITLGAPAPLGGARISLRSSNTSAVRLPASVMVPAGQRSVTFVVRTQRVRRAANVRLTASFRGSSLHNVLQVRIR